MRILITGGAGCLGSNIVERYLPLGHEICVIDNFATSKRELLSDTPNVSLLEGSVADSAVVNKAFAEFEPTHVIHSAAAYKDPNDWAEDDQTNVLGAINVASAANDHAVKRLINFQTALCYGIPERVPVPVSHPVAPITSYGISKSAGEAYIMQAQVPTISLRLANICGPRLAIGAIPTFYKRLSAKQECFCSKVVRDFLDMSDFLALMDIVLVPGAATGVFNVSTGAGNSIREVFDEVASYLGLPDLDVPEVEPGIDDIPAVVLDPTETEKAFGWKAQVGFRETLGRQLQWYDKNGISETYSHLRGPGRDD